MRRAFLLISVVSLTIIQSVAQEKGKISFLAFGDYFYNVQRDPGFASLANTALGGGEAAQAFQFRRLNLTYDYAITEDVSSRFRIEADQAALTSDGKIGVFVKDAYLQWKKVMGNEVFLGIQPTPAFEVSEGVWGYRSLEKTIMDLRGIVSSRDFGVAVRGRIDTTGTVRYWFMVGNGTGNKPETDKLKRYYGNIEVRLKPVVVTIYGDYTPRVDVVNPYTAGRVGNSILTGAAFIGLEATPQLRLGVEGYLQNSANSYNTGQDLVARNSLGISGFARWAASEGIEIVGRYDHFDPNINSGSAGDARGYALLGLAWTTHPGVRIIPNIQFETYETLAGGQTAESAITARVTVVWSLP